MSRNATKTGQEEIQIQQQQQQNDNMPIIVTLSVACGLILFTVVCVIVAYIRNRRIRAKEGAGNNVSMLVKVPSKAGVIQTETIEFVLPYTSAEPTEEEASEQEPGASSSQNSPPGSNNNGSLLTVPQQGRHFIRKDSIAPALYGSSEGEEEQQASWFPANTNLGKVGFSITYKCEEQQMIVTIMGARGLTVKRGKSNHPHVKVALLPERALKSFTKVQKNTTDPVFNEEFSFMLRPEEAQNKILKISVCDFDKLSRRIALGHVFFPLKNLGITVDTTGDVMVSEMWKNLYPKHFGNEEACGELSLSLCYSTDARTLRLGVHKVRNLKTIQDEKDIACLYGKLTLFENDKMIKSKKTGTKKKTLEPDFEETFNIRIARKRLKDVVCTVALCSRNRYGTRKVIGRTQVGPYTLVSGPGADHWSDALQSPNSTVTQWHTLR